jgi:aldehyde:ferredoxin oxidoreductase
MAKEYRVNVLYVDLNSHTFYSEELPEDLTRRYLGGFGTDCCLAERMIPRDAPALAPENAVIFGAGVLGGTMAPAAGKIGVMFKHPMNGAIGIGHGGGHFASRLKWAGYDHLVITGCSPDPVYLYIFDDRVELHPAGDLWGRGTIETTHLLWNRHGGQAGVIAIGPAGERLISFSLALVDNMGTLGRGGLGAVMAGKNLKAVVADGSKGVEVADGNSLIRISRDIIRRQMQVPWRDDWMKSCNYVGWWIRKHRKVKNNSQFSYTPEEVEPIYGPQQFLQFYRHGLACTGCAMSDKVVVELDGPRAGRYPLTSPFHPCISGARWGAPGMREAIAATVEANDQGFDNLSMISLSGFAIDLYRAGLLSGKDFDGYRPDFNPETYSWLREKILGREGIGELLAGGFYRVIREVGPEAGKYAVHIKGIDPVNDPRTHFASMGVVQLTNPRGAYVAPGNAPNFQPGKGAETHRKLLRNMSAGENIVERVTDSPDGFNLPRLIRYHEDWYAAANAMGFCARQPNVQAYTAPVLAELFKAVTGLEKDPSEFLQDGERIWNMYRYINARIGFSRQDDRFPDRFFEPLKRSSGEEIHLMDYNRKRMLSRADIEELLDEYYRERGWDISTGNPGEEKLKALGII